MQSAIEVSMNQIDVLMSCRLQSRLRKTPVDTFSQVGDQMTRIQSMRTFIIRPRATRFEGANISTPLKGEVIYSPQSSPGRICFNFIVIATFSGLQDLSLT